MRPGALPLLLHRLEPYCRRHDPEWARRWPILRPPPVLPRRIVVDTGVGDPFAANDRRRLGIIVGLDRIAVARFILNRWVVTPRNQMRVRELPELHDHHRVADRSRVLRIKPHLMRHEQPAQPGRPGEFDQAHDGFGGAQVVGNEPLLPWPRWFGRVLVALLDERVAGGGQRPASALWHGDLAVFITQTPWPGGDQPLFAQRAQGLFDGRLALAAKPEPPNLAAIQLAQPSQPKQEIGQIIGWRGCCHSAECW